MLALTPRDPRERFRVDGELGRGGMGAVHYVRDRALRRRSGTAVAYRMEGVQRIVIAELGPGDVVGETSIFTGRTRGTNVEATTPVEAMRLTRASIERELGARTWAGAIVRALAYRFNEIDARLSSTQRQLKRYRVLERLHGLLRAAGPVLHVVPTAADVDLDPDDLRDLVDRCSRSGPRCEHRHHPTRQLIAAARDNGARTPATLGAIG